MHGLAGTAILILLVLQGTSSTPKSFAYIASFGLGSMIGMVVLSLAIAIPIRRSQALCLLGGCP